MQWICFSSGTGPTGDTYLHLDEIHVGNQISRIDQPEGQLYHETSEKAAIGIKHLGAFFPNGMMAAS
jgi:hypothetical protein